MKKKAKAVRAKSVIKSQQDIVRTQHLRSGCEQRHFCAGASRTVKTFISYVTLRVSYCARPKSRRIFTPSPAETHLDFFEEINIYSPKVQDTASSTARL